MTSHPRCTFPDCLAGDCGKPEAPCQAGLQAIQQAAQKLVDEASDLGFVLTITQEALQPLAMGHYRTVFSVREARKAA